MFLRRAYLESGAVFLLVLLVYAGSFDNGFHFDDDHSIVKNEQLSSLSTIPRSFVDATTFSGDPQYGVMYRPLVVGSLAINHAISDLDPWSYHVTNVILHALFCLAALALIRRWLPEHEEVAWIAVVVLAVHPVNSQIVNYISARAGILAALGVVLAGCSVSMISPVRRSAATFCAHLLGLLSKSTAIVWGPLLALRAIGRRPDAGRLRLPLATALVASLLFVVAGTVTGFLGPSLDRLVRPLDVQILTQIKACAYYLWLAVVPTHLSVIHSFPVAWEPGAAVVAAAFFLISVLGLALGAWMRRYDPAYGVLWFFVALGVTFIMPLHVIISEHRLYLSSLGAAIFILGVVVHHPPRWGRVWIVVGVVLCSLLTVQRTSIWQSETALWAAALKRAPGNPRVHANIGRLASLDGDLIRARSHYRRALAVDPKFTAVLLNVGAVEEGLGNLQAAAESYRRALVLRPDWGQAARRLGMLLVRMGEMARAKEFLELAVSVSPDADALVGLGVVKRSLGDKDEARRTLLAALQLAPENIDAMVNLGVLAQEDALEDTRSDPEPGLAKARGYYERALQTDSTHQEAMLNLAALLDFQGDYDGAVTVFEKAVKAYPSFLPAQHGLAEALVSSGRMAQAIDVMRGAIARDSSNVRSWAKLGGLYARSNQLDEAEVALRQAVGRGDQRAEILYNLAEVLVVQGQGHWGRGERAEGASRWQQALGYYRRVGAGYRRSSERIEQLGKLVLSDQQPPLSDKQQP